MIKMRFDDILIVREKSLQSIVASALPSRAIPAVVPLGSGSGYTFNGQTVPPFIYFDLLETAEQSDKDLLTAIVGVYKSLPVNTDKATITADGADTATITCSDASIVGDANLAYFVTVDGLDYGAGDVPVSGGAITLTLATDMPGTYIIEIWRKTGNYAHGFILVTAE